MKYGKKENLQMKEKKQGKWKFIDKENSLQIYIWSLFQTKCVYTPASLFVLPTDLQSGNSYVSDNLTPFHYNFFVYFGT